MVKHQNNGNIIGSVLEMQPLYCGYSYGSYALVGIN